MIDQFLPLARLALCDLFGLNVFRHTKDPAVRRRSLLLAGAWGVLAVVMAFYLGALVYGLNLLGMAEAAPAYLTVLTWMVLFFFGIFKTGGVLFSRGGYDTLCSLPLSPAAVVASRFLRLYMEDLAVTAVFLLPGSAVYAWLLRPGALFWVCTLAAVLFTPLLPLSIASLLGALVTGLSARMKHKGPAEAVLTILLVLAVMAATPGLAALEESFTPEMLRELSGLLERLCPPAAKLGLSAARSDLAGCLGICALSAAVAAAVIGLVASRFHAICRRLYSTSARHDYQMTALKRRSVTSALYKREFRRYFASGVYVSNTLTGPVLGTFLCGALCFAGPESVTSVLGVPLDLDTLVPFLVSAIFCLMTTTSTSISMEGKNWWLVKSLPLRTKDILDAKLLLNLSLVLPFYLLSEFFLMLALRPTAVEGFFLLLIPAALLLFSCVYGLSVNLRLPLLSWESEAQVVKQSASSLVGGMGGMVLSVLCAAGGFLVPAPYTAVYNAAVCAVLAALTFWLYRANNRADLSKLE